MTVHLDSSGPAGTRAAGRRLAGILQAGDVVLLAGELGCGKTTFAAGVGEGLGIDERVVSPSFVLVRTYEGFLRLIHADVYRLSTTAELDDLELVEEARDGVLLVEWGQAVENSMPPDHLRVEFEVTAPDRRRIRFVPRGRWNDRSLAGVLG